MPYALCLMPYALCLMPYALCLMPYALCPPVALPCYDFIYGILCSYFFKINNIVKSVADRITGNKRIRSACWLLAKALNLKQTIMSYGPQMGGLLS
jgi:hypothetical protein